MSNTILNSALEYASRGWAVFPLKPRGKEPIYPGGYKIATTDRDQIKSWWMHVPDANIGIATGRRSGGLFVLDLDIDEIKGLNGYESLREWEEKNIELPETVNSITGRGGYHYFFHSDREIKTRAGIIPGVDVRGEGGYVVAPPSVHANGNTYEWEWDPEDYDVSDANDAVYGLLEVGSGPDRNNHYNMPDVIAEGGRNDKLFRMACSLQAQKYSDESIRAMIEIENKQRCNPPLPDKEIDHILSNALSYEKGTIMRSSYSSYLNKRSNDAIYKGKKIRARIQKGSQVFICTNAEDENALKGIGINAFRIDEWKKEYRQYFKGCSVIAFQRNDETSNETIARMSSELSNVAFSRKIVESSKKAGGGVADYLQVEGHTKEDLMNLTASSDCQFASWVNTEGKKPKVNAGLLANEITTNNSIFVARLPGIKSDRVYWFERGVYRGKSDSEMISEISNYIPAAYQSAATLKNVADLIKANTNCISFDDLNNNERFVNLKNGLLDTSSFELVKHDPKVFGTIQLDCRWDPNARADKWCSFIADLCRDEDGNVDQEMVNVLQEWTGLFLSSVHGYRIKRALVFFSPQGNTGKSVFIGVLKSILGIGNIANVPFQDMGSSRWATGRAFGKRLIVVGDQSAESVENSSVFKMLTGGDPVAAEFKGVQGFDYVFNGMMVIACNMLPAFDDDKGNHMAERLMFLNCRNVISAEKRDQFLLDKLCQEKDGIFRWAMVGLKRFIDNGYRFTECSSANDLMDRYRKRNDTLYAFIQEECLPGNNSDIIRKSKFEERYRQYCIDHEVTPLSPRNIQNRAASLGYALYSKDGYRVYRGLKFKDIPGVYGFVPLDDDELIEFDDSGVK